MMLLFRYGVLIDNFEHGETTRHFAPQYSVDWYAETSCRKDVIACSARSEALGADGSHNCTSFSSF